MECVRFVIQKDVQLSKASIFAKGVIGDEITNYIDGRFMCPHEAA